VLAAHGCFSLPQTSPSLIGFSTVLPIFNFFLGELRETLLFFVVKSPPLPPLNRLWTRLTGPHRNQKDSSLSALRSGNPPSQRHFFVGPLSGSCARKLAFSNAPFAVSHRLLFLWGTKLSRRSSLFAAVHPSPRNSSCRARLSFPFQIFTPFLYDGVAFPRQSGWRPRCAFNSLAIFALSSSRTPFS